MLYDYHVHCPSGTTTITMIILHANLLISVDEQRIPLCLVHDSLRNVRISPSLLPSSHVPWTRPPIPFRRFSAVDTLRNDVLHYYNIVEIISGNVHTYACKNAYLLYNRFRFIHVHAPDPFVPGAKLEECLSKSVGVLRLLY